jgi:hypothetical protein
VAQVSWVSLARNSKELIEEMQLLGLGEDPYRAMMEAVLLKFRPVNLDVLPLYIVLLAMFPIILPLVVRWPLWVLSISVGYYAATCHYDWNLPGYPDAKVWFFNPMAWQVVFHAGAAFAMLGPRLAKLDRWRWQISVLAGLYVLFAGFIALSWQYNSLEKLVPDMLARQIYPIDKTNVDILRLVHFMAIAWFVRLAVRPNAAFLSWRILRPLRRCGAHSLQVFCIGTFLALSAQIVDSYFEGSVLSQIMVSVIGITIMSLSAYAADWFKRDSRPEAFT